VREALASARLAYASMLQMSAVIGLHQLASNASLGWRRPQFRRGAPSGQVIFVPFGLFFEWNLAASRQNHCFKALFRGDSALV